MKRYRIQICGENFLLDLDGEHGKFGFSATRDIKAKNREDAERIALIKIHQELNQSAHIIKNTPDSPRVFTESIKELKFFQLFKKNNYKRFDFISEE